MKTFTGRCAVVTGAASGIGLAMARRFHAEGMKLVLADVEEAPLKAAAEALGGARWVKTDVASEEQVFALAEQAVRAFGKVHVLCNNAGVSGPVGPLWEASEADWRWTLDVDLWSVVHGVRAFVPQMLAHGEEAHVVNTASIAGLTSTPHLGAYTVAKFGVVALSEVLAKDLELAGAKVNVSVLCPGFVKTRIADSHRHRAGATANTGAMAEAARAMIDAGLEPDAVADQVVAAIREERFYVLTHPELKPAIASRMKDQLEDRRPKIDPLIRAVLTRS